MATIKIGADELIYWLRKNNKAIGIPNDGIDGLGIKIYHLVHDNFNGKKSYNGKPQPCYWANIDGDKNIGQYNLPKDSTQYQMNPAKLGALYLELEKL